LWRCCLQASWAGLAVYVASICFFSFLAALKPQKTLKTLQASWAGLVVYAAIIFAMEFLPFGGINPKEVADYFSAVRGAAGWLGSTGGGTVGSTVRGATGRAVRCAVRRNHQGGTVCGTVAWHSARRAVHLRYGVRCSDSTRAVQWQHGSRARSLEYSMVRFTCSCLEYNAPARQ
jgi:hypothetical protein